MSTETTSLEDMLEGTPETSAPVAPLPPETGDKSSAAPPADAPPAAETREDDGPTVPRRALEDERKKRQEYERRLAEYERQFQQPAPQQQRQPFPQQPPDPLADPDGYANWTVAVAMQRAEQMAEYQMINREFNRSEKRARKEHGDDTVNAAIEAAKETGMARKFANESDDPYADIVSWYNDYQLARDPQTARQKLEAEILAKYGINPDQSAASPKPKAPVPRSLASTSSAQPRDTRGRFSSDDPTPLEDLIP